MELVERAKDWARRANEASAWAFAGWFALYCVMLLGACGQALFILVDHYKYGWASIPLMSFFCSALAVAACCVQCVRYSQGRAERAFLIAGAPIVFCIAFLELPTAMPDEFTHVNRMFDNRSGVRPIQRPAQWLDAYQWIAGYRTLGDFILGRGDYSQTVPTDYVAASYSVVCYLIPSLVGKVCKALQMNVYQAVIAARVVNGCVYLLAGWWAVRTCPGAKKLLVVFLLNPMLVQQQASVSADVLTNIGILCLFATVLKMRGAEDGLTRPLNWVLLAFFAFLIFTCKIVYVPLVFCMLVLIPRISSKAVRVGIVVALAVGMAGAVAMLAVIGKLGVLGRLLDPAELQKLFMALGATFTEYSGKLLEQYAGANLGWPMLGDRLSPASVLVPVTWIVYLVVLFGSLLASRWEEGFGLSKGARVWFVVLSLGVSFLVFYAMWTDGPQTSAGAQTHVQGRYFIPTSLFLLAAFVGAPRRETRVVEHAEGAHFAALPVEPREERRFSLDGVLAPLRATSPMVWGIAVLAVNSVTMILMVKGFAAMGAL